MEYKIFNKLKFYSKIGHIIIKKFVSNLETKV